jgi:hypothetical protein
MIGLPCYIRKRKKRMLLSMKCMCPCGGGQSCIVDRRAVNDWVHEDEVFEGHKLPLRKHCNQKYTVKQLKALNALIGTDTNV